MLTPYTKPANYISTLDDLPNDVGGLSAEQLKAMFDRFGEEFKDWFNTVHLNEVAAKDRLVNPNLLINPYFRINQRGKNSYTADVSFVNGPDGWKQQQGTMTILANGANFTSTKEDSYKRIIQMTERTLKAGKTYTLSMLCKVNSLNGLSSMRVCNSTLSGVAGASKNLDNTPINIETIVSHTFTPLVDVPNYGVEILVGNTTNDSIDIDMYGWELVPAETSSVANAEPPDIGTDLAKCQRYLLEIAQFTRYRAADVSTNTIDFVVPTATTMRISPNISPELTFAVRQLTSQTNETGFSFSVTDLLPSGCVIIRATKTAHGLSDAKLFVLTGGLLSAEL